MNALPPCLKDTGPTGSEKIYLSRAKVDLCVLIHKILLLFCGRYLRGLMLDLRKQKLSFALVHGVDIPEAQG